MCRKVYTVFVLKNKNILFHFVRFFRLISETAELIFRIAASQQPRVKPQDTASNSIYWTVTKWKYLDLTPLNDERVTKFSWLLA